MLILIGLLPADFALDKSLGASHLGQTVAVAEHLERVVRAASAEEKEVVSVDLATVRSLLAARASIAEIPPEDRWVVRSKVRSVDEAVARLEVAGELSPEQVVATEKDRRALRSLVEYAPGWVVALVASMLGVGTMIGWKRIVVTVGEKIGQSHLTYAQGASAEIVAAATIGASAGLGLPVSTTHVLSSGIAGAMLAGKCGVQWSTVRNIALAWLLTIPAAAVLAGALFLVFLRLIPDGCAAR
jgi:PiT family inorganic phosphate transporter